MHKSVKANYFSLYIITINDYVWVSIKYRWIFTVFNIMLCTNTLQRGKKWIFVLDIIYLTKGNNYEIWKIYFF